MMLFYSLSSVLTKLAAGREFLSLKFLLCYGGALGVLFVYAIAWQQILARVPLTTAYANRAITVGWSMLWSYVIFHERITIAMLAGTAVIAAGIYMVMTSDE